MFKGDQWQRLLTNGPSQLDVFDIFLFIINSDLILDTDVVIKSFDYFASIYDDWYMAIHRFQHTRNNRSKTKEITKTIHWYNYYLEQNINLRGFRRSKRAQSCIFGEIRMILGTLNAHATTITDSHLVYSDQKNLYITIPRKTNAFHIPLDGQLFKNIDHLTIEIDSSMLTFWKDICKRKLFYLLNESL
jgi:hypothetical protein